MAPEMAPGLRTRGEAVGHGHGGGSRVVSGGSASVRERINEQTTESEVQFVNRINARSMTYIV